MFDVTRKATYQHLSTWYEELRSACGNIPCLLVANKIDFDYKVDNLNGICIIVLLQNDDFWLALQVTKKNFKFSETHKLPFFFVSAADGTNVVQVD